MNINNFIKSMISRHKTARENLRYWKSQNEKHVLENVPLMGATSKINCEYYLGKSEGFMNAIWALKDELYLSKDIELYNCLVEYLLNEIGQFEYKN